MIKVTKNKNNISQSIHNITVDSYFYFNNTLQYMLALIVIT